MTCKIGLFLSQIIWVEVLYFCCRPDTCAAHPESRSTFALLVCLGPISHQTEFVCVVGQLARSGNHSARKERENKVQLTRVLSSSVSNHGAINRLQGRHTHSSFRTGHNNSTGSTVIISLLFIASYMESQQNGAGRMKGGRKEGRQFSRLHSCCWLLQCRLLSQLLPRQR